MPLIATPGAANANSYVTVAEADAFAAERLNSDAWTSATVLQKEAALITATRYIDALAAPYKKLYPTATPPYYVIRPHWTGKPATSTQALAWPRIGMKDLNGNDIPSDVIPKALKDATCEFAIQLLTTNSTADNPISVQGITSIKAGPVALTFKEIIESHVWPDAVLNLLVPSWLTDEEYEQADNAFLFEVTK